MREGCNIERGRPVRGIDGARTSNVTGTGLRSDYENPSGTTSSPPTSGPDLPYRERAAAWPRPSERTTGTSVRSVRARQVFSVGGVP